MKTYFCFFLTGILFISTAYSIDASEIQSLRAQVQSAKRELTDSEKELISKFISTALDQMLLSEKSNEAVDIRRQIEQQKGSEDLSYYATAYVAAAHEDIQTAFANAQRLQNPNQRRMMNRNLMVLTAQLKSVKLAGVALERLNDSDDLVRYWAYKAITQPAVVGQLTSEVTTDDAALQAILNGLKTNIINEPRPEIQALAIDFCMAFNDPAAREILLSMAQARIQAYKNWTARNLPADVKLLTALGNVAMLQTDAEIRKNFGRAFAELYAMAFQWYLKGAETMSEEQVDQVLTVIAEVDQEVLARTMKIQTGVMQALRTKRGLDREYESLFGDRMRSGQLAELFKFDYGKDGSGKALTAPPELSPMPTAAAQL